MDRLKIKMSAKESLKGHYGEIILMFIVYALVCFAFGFVAGLLDGIFKTTFVVEGANAGETAPVGLFVTICEILTTALFSFGIFSYFLKLSRNEEVSYKELFSKTNLWFGFIAISFLVALFVSLWSLLLIIPGIIASYSYKLVYNVKLDNPDMSSLEVLRKSKELMRGHRLDFFVLELSFIGWIILGACTFGILYIWLIPYMTVTECNFYNKLINR